MNMGISKIGFSGISPKIFPSQEIHQKPSSKHNEDVFVKTACNDDIGVQKGKFMYTDAEAHPMTQEELNEINEISSRLSERTRTASNASGELVLKAHKTSGKCRQKLDEVKQLYENRTKTTPQGGKIVIQDNTMIEYNKDNKSIVRKTEFKDEIVNTYRASLFGKKLKTIKTKVKSPDTIVEYNKDGTKNIFANKIFSLGYMKNQDGSEECESRVDFSKDSKKYYSEGYFKDIMGNETFKASLYEGPSGATVYAEGEEKTAFGDTSIKLIHRPNIAHTNKGFPPEAVYANYKKDAEGNESYEEKSICTLDGKAYSYVKDFTRTPEGRENWAKNYTRQHIPSELSGSDNEWLSYTPKDVYADEYQMA